MLGFLYSTSVIGTYSQKVISFGVFFFFSLRILGSNLQTCEYDRTQLCAYNSFFLKGYGFVLL